MSLARSTSMVSLYSCGPLLVLLMRNALKDLNESGVATFSQFVIKICDVVPNKDLTKLVWDDYPSSTVLSLLVFCEGVKSLMDKFPFTMLFYRKIIITVCEGREIWI
jgi:hypothetical protein